MAEYIDELRRRRLLAGNSVESTPDESGEVDEPDESPAKTGPASTRFREVLSRQPKSTDYKPSRGRRVMAAIAGGFTGARDPRAGIEVAGDILSSPFKTALGDWEREAKASGQAAGLEEKEAQIEINRQRTQAYEESQHATARFRAAQEQKALSKYEPSTLDEALTLEKARHPGTGWHPQSMEEYQAVHPVKDFVSEEELRNKHAQERQDLQFKHQKELENMRLGGQASHDARVSARQRSQVAKPPSPKDQEAAEQEAINAVLRVNPEHAQFVVGGGTGTSKATGKTVVNPYRIKRADEISAKKSGFLGLGGESDAEISLRREKYRQFLSDVDKKKKEIMGRQAGPIWSLEEEDGEEEQ